MEALYDITLSQLRNQLPLADKSASEILGIYNEAQQIVNDFWNDETSRTDYLYSTDNDSALVLAPVVSSYDNLYLAYLKIKFDEYDGEDTIINDVDATNILISLDEGNITIVDTDPNLVVYTLPILGATLNDTYKISPPRPNLVDINRSGNNVIITADKNHTAFDIEIEKKKEV